MSNTATTTSGKTKKTSVRSYLRALWSTLRTLVFIALLAMVAAYYFFPVIRVHTGGMSPTLSNGDMIVALKDGECQRGDVVAFYFNDKLLVKRVIAVAGDVFAMDEGGHVSLNGQPLDEPYVSVFAVGECDLDMPYTVPEGRLLVLGDQRQLSLDSRSSAIGCVAQEQIVGRILMRFWPLEQFTIY